MSLVVAHHDLGPTKCINFSTVLSLQILYSGKLLREKTFTNFAVLEPPAKVFLLKIWACHTHLCQVFAFHELVTLT